MELVPPIPREGGYVQDLHCPLLISENGTTKYVARLELWRDWWLWRGYATTPSLITYWGSEGLDPMDCDDYEEEHEFPSIKPNIDVLLPPRRSRKQRGWYQVVRWPAQPPARLEVERATAAGPDIPTEIIDAILEGFWFNANFGADDSCPKRECTIHALVCKRWAMSFQKHILGDLTLRSHRDIQDLIAFSQAPRSGFKIHTKKLYVEDPLATMPWIHLLRRLESLFDHRLTVVMSVSGPLTNGLSTIRSVNGRLPVTLPASFNTVSNLHVSDIRFRSFADVLHLLSEIQSLTEFRGIGLSWPPLSAFHSSPRAASGRRMPSMHSAVLTQCSQNWPAFWLANSYYQPVRHSPSLQNLRYCTNVVKIVTMSIGEVKSVRSRMVWPEYIPRPEPREDRCEIHFGERERGASIASMHITTCTGIASKRESDLREDLPHFPSIVEVELSYHRTEAWRSMDWQAFERALTDFPHLRAVKVAFQPEDRLAVLDAGIWARMKGLCKAEKLVLRLQPVLSSRDLRGHGIVPKNLTRLDYGIAPDQLPVASVSFQAHEDHPILLLEDIDYALDVVTCSISPYGNDNVDIFLAFRDEETYSEALLAWTLLRQFILVSAHTTCNAGDERAAWLVRSVDSIPGRPAIKLRARPIGMHGIGRSCTVTYGHSESSTWHERGTGEILDRGSHDYSSDYPLGYNPNIPSRLTLFPNHSNLTSVPKNVTKILNGTSFELTCVDCVFRSNFSVGAEFEILLGNVTCVVNADESCFTLTKATMNFTVAHFEQSANLEVFIGQDFSRSLNWTIFQYPVAGLQVPGLIEIGPAVGVQLGIDIDLSASLNFTFGASAQIPDGAFASVDFVDSKGNFDVTTKVQGWDKAGIQQIPFRINSGELNVTVDAYLAPFAELQFTVKDLGAVARILQNVPKTVVDAALVTAVNRQCEPIGGEDFESFSLAFIVGAGLEVGTVATFDINAGELSDNLDFPTSFQRPFLTHEFPLYPSNGTGSKGCFVLVDDSPSPPANGTIRVINSTALVGLPAASGTLFGAASAVPTWNFTKIESYYSANGHLPTNVNYDQMAAATSIPPQIYQILHPPAPTSSSTATSSTQSQPQATQTSANSASNITPKTVWLLQALVVYMVVVFA